MKAFQFTAKKEDMRKPRIIRVGACQNALAVATTEPVHVQLASLHEKITKFIIAAAASNVNIICFQEVWSKYKTY